MSLEALQERLAALQETTTQLKELIDRLANLKFQPGSVPLGTEEESSVSGELSAEIGQILRNGLEEQELLQEEAKYVRLDSHEKKRLEDGIERLGSDLNGHRSEFRKARISAKKSLVHAQKLERELMIQSLSAPAPASEDTLPVSGVDEQPPQPSVLYRTRHIHQQQQHSSLSEEDKQTVGASSNVTNALRRTHDLIASELSRSEFAHQTLTESSNALKQLDESYGSLDTMLASSRDLLGTLVRSQKSDTWYLQTAFYMLLVTGAWLVFRRLLYGPAWWLVWLPLRIIFGVGSKAGSAVMPGRKGSDGAGGDQRGATDGKASVEGLPSDDLPTVNVGDESKTAVDPYSMLDEVGKIVDGDVANGGDTTAQGTGEEAQNKAEEEHVKDEL